MSSKTRTRTTRTATTTTMTGSAPTLRSVPDQTTAAKVRTDTEDKLWEALRANPNSTAADLSGVAKIGKSTAQKILVNWEADGSVNRTVTRVGFGEGGRRIADRWAITEIDAALVDAAPVDLVDDAPVDDVDATDTALADQDSPATPDATDTDDATPAEDDLTEPATTEPTDAAADDDIQGTTDTDTTDPAEAEPVVANATTEPTEDGAATDADTATDSDDDKARLASGALRGMVEDYLRGHPGKEFGPTAIAKELGGKSSGAVSNALDKLVEAKIAVKTQDKPRRFALAPAEAPAAPAPMN
jgi:hypothetical protein